jgi:hypothetical protein
MWYALGVAVVMIVFAYVMLMAVENRPMGQAICAIEDELNQD